jgi:hypothetical protein
MLAVVVEAFIRLGLVPLDQSLMEAVLEARLQPVQERRTRAAAVERLEMEQAAQAALASLLFVTLTHMTQPHLRQVRPQLLWLADTACINGPATEPLLFR